MTNPAARLNEIADLIQHWNGNLVLSEAEDVADQLRALAVQMPKWGRERPKSPGYYWCRWPHGKDITRIILRDSDGELVSKTPDLCEFECTPVSELPHNLEWAGPLPEPQ